MERVACRRFVKRCATVGDRLEPDECVLDRSAAGFAVAQDQPSARVQRRGHSWQRSGHGRLRDERRGEPCQVEPRCRRRSRPRSFADRHPVSNVTGGDDMAGQSGGVFTRCSRRPGPGRLAKETHRRPCRPDPAGSGRGAGRSQPLCLAGAAVVSPVGRRGRSSAARWRCRR
jgi:hypothetical protein